MEKEPISTLWEDGDILVVNKPPFWVVNRAESIKDETVQDWVEKKLKIDNGEWKADDREARIFLQRSGVAHRLDKETSGCLMIAKNPAALSALLAQFRERIIKKEYLALVHGQVTMREGTVRLPLARSRFDREKWEIRYDGKVAETTWKVERHLDGFTLVRLFPKTGRTHQIRVHLAHLGYPIFSDEKYLTRSKIAADREKLPHHFLHAQKIGFSDMKGELQTVRAPLPADAAELLRWLLGE